MYAHLFRFRTQALAAADADWSLSLLLEHMSCTCVGVHELLGHIHWMKWPIVQASWRLMAHHGFKDHPDVEAHLKRLFFRIGDTRGIECTNGKLRRRYREAESDSWSTAELFRTLTMGEVMSERGLKTVQVPQNCFELPVPELPVPWRRLFHSDMAHGAPGTEALASKGRKAWKSPSPAGEHVAIAAMQAARLLRSQKALRRAGDSWRACTLLPEMLVQLGDRFFLVLASAVYAAKVWPVTVASSGSDMLRVQFSPTAAFEWTVVLDEMGPMAFPYKPVMVNDQGGQHGCVFLEQDRPQVPALAVALADRALLDWQVARFWAATFPADSRPPSAEVLLEHTLDGHPEKAYWIGRWQAGKKVNPETLHLSVCALANMDSDNLEDFRDEKKKYLGDGAAAAPTDPTALTLAAEPSGERAPVVNRKAGKAPTRGTPKWLKELSPGAGAPLPTTKKHTVERILDRCCFTAFYELVATPANPLERQYRQHSKTRSWSENPQGRREATQHEALQQVLQWQWGKHKAVTGESPPLWVQTLLQECASCKQRQACQALEELKASAARMLAGQGLGAPTSGSGSAGDDESAPPSFRQLAGSSADIAAAAPDAEVLPQPAEATSAKSSSSSSEDSSSSSSSSESD